MTDVELCPYCAGSGAVKVATTRGRSDVGVTRQVCWMCGGTGKLAAPAPAPEPAARRWWRALLRIVPRHRP